MVRDNIKLKLCVVALFNRSTQKTSTPLNVFNTLLALKPIASRLYLITNMMPDGAAFIDKINIIDMKIGLHRIRDFHPMWISILIWTFKNIAIQMRMSWILLKKYRDIDILFFTSGYVFLSPVMLLAKMLRMKVIVQAGGRYSSSLAATGYRVPLFYHVVRILEQICYSISDNIAVQSENAIHFLHLDSFRNKISIYSSMFVDTALFRIKSDISTRRSFIGFISNLEEAKGVLNFVRAIPLLLKEHDETEFLIGGYGKLFDQIKNELINSDLSNKVKLTGWIAHDELPGYLNELKILVLPSYSEGIPAIVQEAMACGAIVVATPVGGIPGLIKDRETGFILEDNSPECIARNVIRALSHPDLDKITSRARKLIEDEYNYEAVVEKCRVALSVLWG